MDAPWGGVREEDQLFVLVTGANRSVSVNWPRDSPSDEDSSYAHPLHFADFGNAAVLDWGSGKGL
jgi:hypothetical protein